jgi:hypothetical protein
VCVCVCVCVCGGGANIVSWFINPRHGYVEQKVLLDLVPCGVDRDVQDGGNICSFVSLRQGKQKPNKSHISSTKINRAESECVLQFLARVRKRFSRTLEILLDNICTHEFY